MPNAIKNLFRPFSILNIQMRYPGSLQNDSSIFSRKIKCFLLYASFSLILFGVKLWVIYYNGNATPFWDQWDAEAHNLYYPFLNHTLSWHQMFDAHNEHRIFTTRVLALILLKINGTWNPLFQMVINSWLHIFAIIVAVYLLNRIVGKNSLVSLLAFSLVLFGIPYGWENILAGFQGQFYFVLLFSLLSLWLTLYHEPLSLKWWYGILCAAFAYLSLASGVFVLAAEALVSIVVFFSNRRRTPRQLWAITILGILFMIGIKLTPTIPGHAPLKASSFHQLYESLTTVFGWPVSNNLIGAFICNLPLLVIIIMAFRRIPKVGDIRWLLYGLIIWVVAQAVSIAYGRAAAPLASRYRDLFAILIFINFGCLLYILHHHLSKWKSWIAVGSIAWISCILISLTRYSAYHLPEEINWKRDISSKEEMNTKNYLASGDINYLKDKPFLEIPYPDGERLASILELPGIRGILPFNLNAPLKPDSIEIKPANAFINSGYYFTTPKRADTTWGSYIPGPGDTVTGEMSLHFKNTVGAKKIAVPIAGYPLRDGMNIEIEQNGTRKHLAIEDNPRESWGTGYGTIRSGDFSIVLKDSSHSTWLAVAGPTIQGRFDGQIAHVLKRYYMFILFGVLGIIFFIIQSGLTIKHTTTITN